MTNTVNPVSTPPLVEKTHVKTLREAHNSQGLTGKISYFFSYIGSCFGASTEVATAYEKDAKAIALKAAAEKAVEAIAGRGLLLSEVKDNDIGLISFTNNRDASEHMEMRLRQEGALKDFYDAFKERVDELGVKVDSGDYVSCVKEAIALLGAEMVSLHANKRPVSRNAIFGIFSKEVFPQVNFLKLQTSIKEFNEIVYEDILHTYARRDLKEITPSSYSEVDSVMQELFRMRAKESGLAIRETITSYHGEELAEKERNRQRTERRLNVRRAAHTTQSNVENFYTELTKKVVAGKNRTIRCAAMKKLLPQAQTPSYTSSVATLS